jgi:hypothetical protein
MVLFRREESTVETGTREVNVCSKSKLEREYR